MHHPVRIFLSSNLIKFAQERILQMTPISEHEDGNTGSQELYRIQYLSSIWGRNGGSEPYDWDIKITIHTH